MKSEATSPLVTEDIATFRGQLLQDFRLACLSREASLLGRKEVLGGKAKFGIFGDGKELAQLALARVARPGDWRSGYYRDQTLMLALGLIDLPGYFASLYADADVEREPTSGGRQMSGHFATRFIDADGGWLDQQAGFNSSADISPTAGQMPRLLGLAQASKVYRSLPELAAAMPTFTRGGDEIAFGTIGDASTSEGAFWETMNAACVLQVPLLMSVWDDGYGISVPKRYQTTKESISEALSGLRIEEGTNGMYIYTVRGWDYPALVATYEEAAARCRAEHVPVLVHVEEVTQPQGHSTSGSHERYKTPEQLEWAKEFDCIVQFERFILLEGAASEDELAAIKEDAKSAVRTSARGAWEAYRAPIEAERAELVELLRSWGRGDEAEGCARMQTPGRAEVFAAARAELHATAGEGSLGRAAVAAWVERRHAENAVRYSAHLYSEGADSALRVAPVPVRYDADAPLVDGRQVLNRNFQEVFERRPEVLTFGEDTGKIGGVNQVMEGMQERFGEVRVSDTGIRELTILGQGIGLAMRGLRPIAEIQYLDYLYYALQLLRDDLATVRYRSAGGQKSPVIVRTRGHRLEGIWHSGSPMGAIVHSVRGMYVCVPRNFTEAAGLYNTLLEAGEPALVVECLNGYRLKERMPANPGEYRIPLGVVDTVRPGRDLTIVSYGSTCNIAERACGTLARLGIEAELIDCRTLLPFDLDGACARSVARTNRLLIVDEDVPGGASAYLLDAILHGAGAYHHLDSAPVTLTARPHLPPYGSDGDYFSKPSHDDIVEAAYAVMSEADPARYPDLGTARPAVR